MAKSVITEAQGERVFVIGDIHGCPDEPRILLEHLEKEEGLTDFDVVVFLGDYIDRGPDSKGVLDLLLDFKLRFPKSRFLKGNHEVMMLDFLGFGGSLGQAFLYNGGLETLQSYGISVFSSPQEMTNALPPNHFKFLCGLESVIKIGNFLCVHAGLDPEKSLEDQSDNDIFWIRDDFIANPHNFDHIIIFGHTPYREIFINKPYKIGLDTGLVFGNKLSCLELSNGKLMQVERGAKSVNISNVEL